MEDTGNSSRNYIPPISHNPRYHFLGNNTTDYQRHLGDNHRKSARPCSKGIRPRPQP
jgi:hypothetical protein